MLKNSIRTARLQTIIGTFIAVVFIGIFIVFIGRFIWRFSEQITVNVLEGLLGFGFVIVFALVILMGLGQVFKSLFDSSDLEMLFAMPIPTKSIFWMKFIQSYFSTALFMFVVMIVPMYIYGFAVQAPFVYFVVSFISLLAITLISLSIIYLINLLLIQILPARRANEFLMVTSFISGIVVFLMIRLPDMLLDRPVSEVILKGLPLFPDWLPISWASRSIIATLDGEGSVLLPLALLIIMTVVFMIVSAMLVERSFLTGWVQMGEKSSRKRRRKKTTKGGKKSSLKRPVVALTVKEWNLVKRDLREWLTLMPIFFFFVFGLIGFFGSGVDMSEVRNYPKISWMLVQGMFLFVIALTNGTVAAASIGREGQSFWMSKVLPMTGWQLTLGKFWISWLMPFLIVLVLDIVLFFVLNWSILFFLLGIVIKIFISAGISSMGVWIGTIGGRYNPTNPNQRLSFGSTILLMALSYGYLLIALIPMVYAGLPTDILSNIDAHISTDRTIMAEFFASLITTPLLLKVKYPLLMNSLAIIVLLIFVFGVTYMFLSLSAKRFEKGFSIDMISGKSTKK
ncbi:MAG TPA: hypothetical protein VK061_04835 [Bacillota bacterium]|nr:hypothetical protein [Bacillota bacterium]